MKIKKEKYKKLSKNKYITFLKNNLILLILIFLSFFIIIYLSYIFISSYINNKNFEKEISNIKFTNNLSINKVVCYSNATGKINNNNQSFWDLNLSQYTDIAIYINKNIDIDNMYIDTIYFNNPLKQNLSLSYLPIENFGSQDNIIYKETTNKINLPLLSPITLRYLNSEFAKNKIITEIDTPLYFNGKLLEKAKIPLSSLKNTVRFTLHIITKNNEEFIYKFNIPISLQNKEKNLYDGDYIEETPYKNAYFIK